LQEPEPLVGVDGPLHVLGTVERSGRQAREPRQAAPTGQGQQGPILGRQAADAATPSSEHGVRRGGRAAHEHVGRARDGLDDEVSPVPGDGIEAEEHAAAHRLQHRLHEHRHGPGPAHGVARVGSRGEHGVDGAPEGIPAADLEQGGELAGHGGGRGILDRR